MKNITPTEVLITTIVVIYMAFLSFNILSLPFVFTGVLGSKIYGALYLSVAISIFLFVANGFMLYAASSFLKNQFDTIKQRGKKDEEADTSAQ